MSYLVPREIPSDCTKCRWAMCNYPTVYCRLMHKGSDMLMAIKSRPDWCPLIEILFHGTLIDVDAMLADLTKYMRTLDPESKEYSKALWIETYLNFAKEELRYYGIRIPKDRPKDTPSNECVGNCEECKPSIYINCKIKKVIT